MTVLKRTRVEDFEEVVVIRPLRTELDRTLVQELVQELDLLSDPPAVQPAPQSTRRR